MDGDSIGISPGLSRAREEGRREGRAAAWLIAWCDEHRVPFRELTKIIDSYLDRGQHTTRFEEVPTDEEFWELRKRLLCR